jgi:hypothetical protein
MQVTARYSTSTFEQEDDVLTLRRLADNVVAQEHRVGRSGPASVGTICLVIVSLQVSGQSV